MDIAFVGGAGRLGLALAAWSAHKGHRVTIADINMGEVCAINAREVVRHEPHVAELVNSGLLPLSGLRATTNIAGAAGAAELITVIVPTPSTASGAFSNEYVLVACCEIAAGLRRNRHEYPVVEISSTVMPGSTMGPIRKALEDGSGLKAGEDFGLAYSPEFIRQGQIIYDYAYPDMMLIGATDLRTASIVTDYYMSVIENDPPFHVMSVVSAEIAKLGLNSAVVAKMAVANTLATLCHATPGADARDVLDVVGSDSRIGHKFFSAGTWPGGPCFPRDCRALSLALASAGVPAIAVAGVDAQRGSMAQWLAGIVGRLAGTTKTVGILGLAYKPGVDIVEESQGLSLANLLEQAVVQVITHDPVVQDKLPGRQRGLEQIVTESDILVLMTCWPEYRERLGTMDLRDKIVLDMWGFLEDMPIALDATALYYRFGEGL